MGNRIVKALDLPTSDIIDVVHGTDTREMCAVLCVYTCLRQHQKLAYLAVQLANACRQPVRAPSAQATTS